jgi:hypothetical protein
MILRRPAPVLAFLLTACGGGSAPAAQETGFPDAPAALERPAEYRWGDAVAARDNRMAQHVAAALGARFGTAREDHYVTSADGLATLRNDYARRLGPEWAPLSLSWSAGEHGFAFANGEQAIVVAWLDPQPDSRVPVTVFRFDGVRGSSSKP